MEISLGSLQLNEQEVEIYRKVLVSGQLSHAEIIDKLSLSEDVIESTLNSLQERKLLRKVPGMIDRYACLLPVGSTKQELESAAQDVAVLGREIDSTAEQEVAKLQSQLDEAKAELQADVDQKLADLDQSLNDLKGKINNSKQNSEQGIEQTKSASQENINSKFGSITDSVGQFADKFHTEASGRITSKRETIERKISSGKSAQETIKNEAGADLQELDTNALENSKTESIATISRLFGSSKTQVEGIKSNLDSSISSIKSEYMQHTAGITAAGQQFTEGNTTVLTDAKTTLSTQVAGQQEKFDELTQSFQEASSSMNASVQSGVENQSNFEQQVNQSISQVSSDVAGKLSELQTSLQSDTESVNSEFSQFLEDTAGKISTHQDGLEASLKQSITDQANQIKVKLQEQINQFIEATSSQLDQMTSQFASQIAASSAEVKQERDNLRETISSNLMSKKEAMNQKVANSVNAGKSSVEHSMNENLAQFSEQSATFKQQLSGSQQRISQTIDSINNELLSGKTSLGEWSTSLQQKIDAHLQEQNQVFNQALEMGLGSIKQEIENTSSGLMTQSDELHNSLVSQLTTAENETSQMIETSIQTTIASITSLHENMKQRFETAISKSRDEYNSLLDQNKGDMNELLTQLDQDASVIKEDITSSLNQQLQDIKSNFDNLVQTVHSHTQELIQSIETSMNEQVNQSENIGKQVISSVQDLSAKTTGSQINAVQTTFNNYGIKYKETTDVVSDKITALASILDTVFKLQEETETPTIKTTHVVGKSSIVKYVNEMIGRMKSKITILVPDISMIFDSKIMELGMTSQVTIVSHIDEIDHKDWIDKMHGAKANVTLRSLTKQGFGAQLPDFIGAEREGEEIIIGTLDEGAKDYVAIASNSEYFVQIFGSQIISEYSRGRSKQLQK